ncbi:hypothetical protein [Nocardia sp. NPDC050793]|uniref:hypothetical protein n=1 Tax=Nocardia sp. NPDC050793 TaxID=3155159 RepID=UPI0033CB09B6
MFAVVFSILAVAVVRLWNWKAKRTRLMTLAMLTVGAAYIFALPPADSWLDPRLAGLLGENISDLLLSLGVIAACWLYGRLALRALDSTGDADRRECRHPRGTLAWSITLGAAAVGLVLTSRLGESRTRAVDHEFALIDATTRAYNAIAAVPFGLTCALLAAAAITALLDQRPGRLPFLALAAATVYGCAAAIVTLVLLLVDPEMLADHIAAFTAGTSGPIIVCLVIAGLWGARPSRSTRQLSPSSSS